VRYGGTRTSDVMDLKERLEHARVAAMLACGVGLREAVQIANRAGGIVVGKFGTATVSYNELFAVGS
jgi:bifunctional ADP-heptose synthase (sugar kinase/adenylyltransferase)